jgi:phosphoenolpyruvate synthase/pyruvate phosphate dikinase
MLWRARAVKTARVVLAEPSVVIQNTVAARSSGVILSRGTDAWLKGRGVISASWGIGSVVEAAAPVEEFSMASGEPLRLGYSVARREPRVDSGGGLREVDAPVGTPVLTEDQANELNDVAQRIETRLGDRPRGWDIEWAIDGDGIKILQARPNF